MVIVPTLFGTQSYIFKTHGCCTCLDFMFSLIKGFEAKLNIFIYDKENCKLK